MGTAAVCLLHCSNLICARVQCQISFKYTRLSCALHHANLPHHYRYAMYTYSHNLIYLSQMTTLKECCLNLESGKNLTLSDVVLLFVDYTSTGRSVVEMGKKVCKDEETKLILGYPNEYAKCIHVLHLAESTNAGMTNTVSAEFTCPHLQQHSHNNIYFMTSIHRCMCVILTIAHRSGRHTVMDHNGCMLRSAISTLPSKLK